MSSRGEANLRNYLGSENQGVGRYLRRQANIVKNAARVRAPARTGRLKRSIKTSNHRRESYGQSIEISAKTPYAYDVHEGTRPHLIEPRAGKVLRFGSGSRIIYTTHAEHPGHRPNRFLSDGLKLIKRR